LGKNNMKLLSWNIAVLLMLIAVPGRSAALAADGIAEASYRATLAAVRPPELPAKAAQTVKSIEGEAQLIATAEVVKATAAINPSALLSVVGAISRSTAKAAPVAAATAAEVQPRFAWAFARTAALAAPDQASAVVYAVATAVPKEAQAVATAVAQAVPESSASVLAALGRATPSLQPFLDEAILLADGRNIAASTIIDQANKLMAAAPTPVTDTEAEISAPTLPPRVGPPFVNPPGNPPVHVTPGPPFEVPPGWQRKYSKPGKPF
jgi:hypothetical protein